MVQRIDCECSERIGVKIDSVALFVEIKEYFSNQVVLGVYKDILVEKPYFVGVSAIQTIVWRADKWYKCQKCGCLWEFTYPDFPAKGFVRKFEDGTYKERGF